MKLHGTLITDADGELCLRMRLSPQSPSLEDIPLKELLEELEGQRVGIEIIPTTSEWRDVDP